MEEKKVTRKESIPVKVWCLPEEKQQIESTAKTVGQSASSYLRNVGLGYKVQGVLDHAKVEQLAKINADQGRLGGLLKLWLTHDKKLAGYSKVEKEQLIQRLLERIEQMQCELLELVKKIPL